MNIDDRKHAENLDAVSRAYRGAARDNDDMMPSAAIDDAVRAAARRAVQSGPQPTGKNWLGRWTPQLAVAAVVVLSVSVVLVSVEERPELAPAPVQKITLSRQSEQPVASNAGAPPAVISTGKMETRAQDMAAPSKPAEPVRARISDQNIASASKSGFAFAPPPEVQISEPLERAKKEDRGSAEIDRTVRLATGQLAVPPIYAPSPAPTAPATSSPTPSAPAPSAPVPSAPAARSAAPQHSAGAPRIDARQDARVDSQVAAVPEAKRLAEKAALADAAGSHDAIAKALKATSANAVTAPGVLASAASPPAPGAPTPLPKLKQPSAAELQRTETDESRRNQAPAVSVGVRGIGQEQIAAADALAKDSRPGPWLKRMLELHEQNKLKELRGELARFQKAHPNVVLPKTLAQIADSRE